MANTTRRSTASNARNSNNFTSKRLRLARILSDGRRYRMTTLVNRLNSPDYAVRGRISELRSEFGVNITHSGGFVQAQPFEIYE